MQLIIKVKMDTMDHMNRVEKNSDLDYLFYIQSNLCYLNTEHFVRSTNVPTCSDNEKYFHNFFHARFVGKNMFIKMHHFNYREAEYWAIRVVFGGVCSLSSALSTTGPARSALRHQAKSP